MLSLKNRVLAALILGVAGSCAAQGALDWADPCVSQGKKVATNSAAARARYSDPLKDWDNRTWKSKSQAIKRSSTHPVKMM